MSAPPPPPYNPAPFIVASTGLTPEQLATQFESFKDSLRYASVAPELVFERILANLCVAAPIPMPRVGSGDLKSTRERPGHETKRVQESVEVSRDEGICSDKSENTATGVDGSTRLSELPAVAMRFRFEGSYNQYGVSATRDNVDGIYDFGNNWSALGLHSEGLLYGYYNTTEVSRGIPMTENIERTITFSTSFTGTPQVLVWLTALDMRCGKFWKVAATVLRSSNTDFVLGIRTSGEGVLYGAGVSWIAYETVKVTHEQFKVPAHSACETSATLKYDCSYQPGMKLLVVDEVVTSGEVSSELDVSFSSVSQNQMSWHLAGYYNNPAVCILGVKFLIFEDLAEDPYGRW